MKIKSSSIQILFILDIFLIVGIAIIFGFFHYSSAGDTEKLVFLTSAAVIPIFSLIYVILDREFVNYGCDRWLSICGPLLIGIVLFCFLLNSQWIIFLSHGFCGIFSNNYNLILLVFFIVSLLLNIFLLKINIDDFRCSYYYKTLNWMFFLGALFLTLFSWRIFSIHVVNHGWQYFTDLDVGLYPLTQVVKGKTILVDLPSQYGLYPEIIAPLFKLIGLSVIKYSLLMASLQIVSLISLFYILIKLIRNPLLLFIGWFALIILTFENILYLSGTPNPYYQYWPIRFFWPAISVFIVYFFCKNKSMRKSIFISFIAAIATIWNLDTGIFIFISYGVYLVTKYLFLVVMKSGDENVAGIWNKQKFLISIILHLAVFIVIISMFLLILRLTSGQPLQFSWLYKYQVYFYKLGNYVITVPKKPNPWMIVVSIYLYGLIISLYSFKRKATYKTELMFYLSMLGVGLFTYYTGRAHVLNLFSVMWPSIILSVLFADNLIRLIRLKIIHFVNLIYSSAIISILLMCCTIFMINIPRYYVALKTGVMNINVFASTLTASELNFIKINTTRGNQCLLWIKNQASYYAEAGLLSPIKGPGLIETLTSEDITSISKEIKRNPPDCVFLGTSKSAYNPGFNYSLLFRNYAVVGKNKEGSILFLKPKPPQAG